MAKTAVCGCGGAKAKQGLANDPMRPRLFSVTKIKRELSDTFTMILRAEDGSEFKFKPGQFNMLYVFGVGEIPISISGDPSSTETLVHTTRAVGKVSQALGSMKPGDVIGVRGPYGTFWPVNVGEGMDLVFVPGGIGLAPLRPAIYQVLNERHKFGNIAILYGARRPEDILFPDEISSWRKRFDLDVQVTVDRASGDWKGKVGLVTNLISGGGYDRDKTVAFTCGPEVMMVNVAKALQERGVPQDRIFLSMERNMKCGVGICGHCQWGTTFICRDGPVFRLDQIAPVLPIKEL